MVDTHLSYPFGPMKITGKSLIGIYESCDNKNLIMVKYNLLDYGHSGCKLNRDKLVNKIDTYNLLFLTLNALRNHFC